MNGYQGQVSGSVEPPIYQLPPARFGDGISNIFHSKCKTMA